MAKNIQFKYIEKRGRPPIDTPHVYSNGKYLSIISLIYFCNIDKIHPTFTQLQSVLCEKTNYKNHGKKLISAKIISEAQKYVKQIMEYQTKEKYNPKNKPFNNWSDLWKYMNYLRNLKLISKKQNYYIIEYIGLRFFKEKINEYKKDNLIQLIGSLERRIKQTPNETIKFQYDAILKLFDSVKVQLASILDSIAVQKELGIITVENIELEEKDIIKR